MIRYDHKNVIDMLLEQWCQTFPGEQKGPAAMTTTLPRRLGRCTTGEDPDFVSDPDRVVTSEALSTPFEATPPVGSP